METVNLASPLLWLHCARNCGTTSFPKQCTLKHHVVLHIGTQCRGLVIQVKYVKIHKEHISLKLGIIVQYNTTDIGKKKQKIIIEKLLSREF